MARRVKREIAQAVKRLPIVERDPYLRPYESALIGRADYAKRKETELTGGAATLAEWATGYLYYGLHHRKPYTDAQGQVVTGEWVLREWAPNATAIYIKGDMNGWQKDERYRMQPIGNGVWEIVLPEDALRHEQYYRLLVEWQGGYGERIPSYARRVVQDEQTKIFSAQVWDEEPYAWRNRQVKKQKAQGPRTKEALYIYECHIGMAQEVEGVGTYKQFEEKGIVVIGISRDSVASHAKFAAKYELPFVLLSDPELSAIEAYGVWQEKKMCGKVSMGVVRTTYVIDENGVIEKAMPKVKPDTNAAEILAYLTGDK